MARNERLIVRHPAPKPEHDRYMLDRWTPEAMHRTRQVYRDVRHGDRHGAITLRWYRVECLCGWRTVELPRPVAEKCPVLTALEERARTMKRAGERIEWKPFQEEA
jgi:hypothetical protein